MTPTDRYLAEAASLGDRFAADAVWFQDRCNWASRAVPYRTAGHQAELYPQLMALNPSVYSGTAGMALAMARLAHFSDDSEHRRVAVGAMNHALADATETNDGDLGAVGGKWRYGFYLGTLGIAWVAAEVGALLGDEFFSGETARLLRSIQGRLDEPMDYDVMFGPASAIPTLLDLNRRGYHDTIELAVELGNELVKTAIDDGAGRLSWGTRYIEEDRHNLSGLSHGTSGMAVGLAELWHETHDDVYLETVRGALRYERHHFYPEEGNWPNYQQAAGQDGRHVCATAWCHGAAGIGLARTVLRGIVDDPEIDEEIAIAAATTRQFTIDELDYPGRDVMLCHGLLGNVECQWAMDEALGRTDVVDRMRVVGDELAARYGAGPRRRWGSEVDWPTGVTNGLYPPLITGGAGVLHFYLRLHAPAEVPTVLLPARGIQVAQPK